MSHDIAANDTSRIKRARIAVCEPTSSSNTVQYDYSN